MKKFSYTKVSRLTHSEFQQFMNSGLYLYTKHGKHVKPVQESLNKITELTATLGPVVQTKTKHDLSSSLELLEEKRTKLIMGIKKSIESWLYDEKEQVASDAKALLEIYDFHIGNYRKLKLKAKTGKTESLLADLEKIQSLKEAVDRLGIRERVNTLAQVNSEYFIMYLDRITSRREFKLNIALRKQMLKKFQDLVLDTEAYIRLNKDDGYKTLLDNIEKLYLQYTASNAANEVEDPNSEDPDFNLPPDIIEDMGSSTF